MTNQLEPHKMPIVTIRQSKTRTNSLWIAKEFDKQHKNVIRDIKNLDCSKEFSASNFGCREYIDIQGKTRPMYEMTFNGFMYLVMGYTGEKAAMIKEAYICEFDRRSAALTRRKNDEWKALRESGKHPRLFEADVIAEYVEYAKANGSKNAERYYATITRETYKALFDVHPEEMKRIRTLLTARQIAVLTVAEMCVERELTNGMEANLPYKGPGGIFERTMNAVRELGETTGRTVVPMVEKKRKLRKTG
jgi:Rha family phage regulatory protein